MKRINELAGIGLLTFAIVGATMSIIGLTKSIYECIDNYYKKKYLPSRVYVRELNNDGREDIIIRTEKDYDIIYLQQKDGSYRRLEEYQNEFKSRLKDSIKDLNQNTYHH